MLRCYNYYSAGCTFCKRYEGASGSPQVHLSLQSTQDEAMWASMCCITSCENSLSIGQWAFSKRIIWASFTAQIRFRLSVKIKRISSNQKWIYLEAFKLRLLSVSEISSSSSRKAKKIYFIHNDSCSKRGSTPVLLTFSRPSWCVKAGNYTKDSYCS